jgi:hypothetical protein
MAGSYVLGRTRLILSVIPLYLKGCCEKSAMKGEPLAWETGFL